MVFWYVYFIIYWFNQQKQKNINKSKTHPVYTSAPIFIWFEKKVFISPPINKCVKKYRNKMKGKK